MANAAHNAPKLQIGNLSPEDAERLASTFRPVWELDDAPFAQGGALSAADVDALSAGAGVRASVRGADQELNVQGGTFEIPTQVSPPPRVPAPDEPKVEISIDVDPEPTPPPVAQAHAQSATVPRRPYAAPQAPPVPVRMARDVAGSGDFVPVKKSNTGIILVGVGAIVVVGAIFGIKAMMSGDSKSSTAATATAEPTHTETAHIPPPPPDTAVAAPQQTQQAVQTPPPPPAQTEETVEPPPTHHAAAPVTAPAHTHTATATHTAAAGHGHAHGHTSIVRDNPF